MVALAALRLPALIRPKPTLAKRVAALNLRLAPQIEITLSDTNVLTVWLNRTDKRNALSFAMMDQLVWLAQTLATWRDVRAVVIGGRGQVFAQALTLPILTKANICQCWH